MRALSLCSFISWPLFGESFSAALGVSPPTVSQRPREFMRVSPSWKSRWGQSKVTPPNFLAKFGGWNQHKEPRPDELSLPTPLKKTLGNLHLFFAKNHQEMDFQQKNTPGCSLKNVGFLGVTYFLFGGFQKLGRNIFERKISLCVFFVNSISQEASLFNLFFWCFLCVILFRKAEVQVDQTLMVGKTFPWIILKDHFFVSSWTFRERDVRSACMMCERNHPFFFHGFDPWMILDLKNSRDKGGGGCCFKPHFWTWKKKQHQPYNGLL